MTLLKNTKIPPPKKKIWLFLRKILEKNVLSSDFLEKNFEKNILSYFQKIVSQIFLDFGQKWLTLHDFLQN